MKIFAETVTHEMDTTFCKLESLGSMLTQLSTMENQAPDMTALADLGRLISEQAMKGLDLISKGKTTILVHSVPK